MGSPKDTAAPTLSVRRPHLSARTSRGRILIIGASGQVGGALMEAFGPQDCIGTYSGTKVQGMIQFDLAQCAMQPQLADDLMQTVTRRLSASVQDSHGWMAVRRTRPRPTR